jgi:hypothetical protein
VRTILSLSFDSFANLHSGRPGDSLGGANRDKLSAFNFGSLSDMLAGRDFLVSYHSPTESVI